MDASLPLLKVGPSLALRKERVDLPELGGSVFVVGLTASQSFAVTAVREQALARLHAELHAQRGKDAKPLDVAERTELLGTLEPSEWQRYGRYVPELLARAVQIEGGLPLYTADEWELMQQHHPALLPRLQRIAERLSGLEAESTKKNLSGQG